MAKSSSAERYRLRDGYLAIRNTLLDDRFSDRLDRSLGYWALPADRRLPVALMALSLRQILNTPFEQLAATPGIGQRKLNTLILLMRRALDEQPPSIDIEPPAAPAAQSPWSEVPAPGSPLDPTVVSEGTWEQWCSTVRDFGLLDERLGRLAPTLQDLPTVIWTTPLADYAERSLGEIRGLKTHGEKRVRVVLDVFRTVHHVLGHGRRHPGLSVRLSPSFVPPLEEWFDQQWARRTPLSLGDLRQNLVLPIVNQLANDAGSLIQKLIEGRLGIEGPPEPVRRLADSIGVTRARVYQLLETCARVMEVRWPEGRARFCLLESRLGDDLIDADAKALYRTLHDLLYPAKEIGAPSLVDLESQEERVLLADAE